MVDPTIVGDVTAPLLRVVAVDHKLVTTFSLFAEFKCSQYVPLRANKCNIICIFISIEKTGEKMKSTCRRFVVTLKFRPVVKGRDSLTL